MDIVYVCKAVDESDPVLANQVRWIRSLADRPQVGQVHVLTPRRGPATLPANVTVRVFGSGPPLGSLRSAAHFLVEVGKVRHPSFALVVQGGPYPALLLPWKLLGRLPVYQWKAMPHISRRMSFYARYCDDLVFTATPSSFPMDHPKVRPVGHGIDTALFHPRSDGRSLDLLVVTRISPVKALDQVIRAVAECRRMFGVSYTLDIVGPTDSKNQDHRRDLLHLVSDLGLDGSVRLLGGVEQDTLPDLMSRYKVGINFSRTAFDKAAGETMASGLPLLTTNRCVAEILPPDLACQLVVPADDLAAQAAAIHRVLTWDDATRLDIGQRSRAVIVDDHSLDAIFAKILAIVEENLRRPGKPPG